MESHKPDNYEFSDVQNGTIAQLASAMKFVAIVEIILGVVYGVLALFGLISGSFAALLAYSIQCVLTLILAVMLNKASGHFRSVVDTEGDDVVHMMNALEELRSYFSTKKVLYIIAMVLIAIAVVAVVMLGMRSTPTSTHYY